MAGAGWRQFTRATLASADVQLYLMDQAVMAFDSASQRTTELVTPEAGMVSYLRDSDRYEGRTPAAGGGLTGGVWRGFGRSWGVVTGALPAPVAGNLSTPQTGDTAYVALWRCSAIVQGVTAPTWRQLEPAHVATLAERTTLTNDASAGGAALPDGFMVYVQDLDRVYVLQAGVAWRLIGGKAGAEITLTTGTGAPATGWTGAGYNGALQHHGNGMATVTFDVVRSGANITPSTTGDVTNVALLTLPAGWEARAATSIGPGPNGNRAAFGSIGTNSRVLSLFAVTGTADIATGATISLSGTYALAAPQDLDA
jgi:hypothetical protein